MQAQLTGLHAGNTIGVNVGDAAGNMNVPIVTYNGNQYCVITRAPDSDGIAMQKPLEYGPAATANIIVMSPMLPPQQQQPQQQQQQQQ
ncbi:uncharacterized protein Dmoj_GI10627 [Drosophila mojavensis]|uniref:Uncharacterized protein n=2 Tax=Drosophila mojavensis TaxID=7230 RepID=A0A0Q9X499_DROMO|nr:uncharacterized protein Dmoj_GI10627 [Drosophila mojavensis]